jgi:hypothetical protein
MAFTPIARYRIVRTATARAEMPTTSMPFHIGLLTISPALNGHCTDAFGPRSPEHRQTPYGSHRKHSTDRLLVPSKAMASMMLAEQPPAE